MSDRARDVDHTPVVRDMTAGDLAEVCDVIGAAFADNPSTLATVRGDAARAATAMRGAVRVAKFGRPWSRASVACQGGEIVGAVNAAPWPRCQMGTAEKIKTAPAMLMIMRGSLFRAMHMMNRRAAHDPPAEHWHVGPLGVRPDRQGQGIGTLLMHALLRAVDGEGVGTFLETDVDRNVVFYERLGFTVTDTEEISGVPTRFMWRRPRP
jgi:ribosomal protein S18 acetylase RimI-like enzyme